MEFDLLLTNPDWVLAHFTLAADLTTLREECRFAHTGAGVTSSPSTTGASDKPLTAWGGPDSLPKMVVARYLGLPFAALSFLGESPAELAELAARLIGPDEPFYLLLNERQARLAERAFAVEQVQPEWQMLFSGHPAALNRGAAMPLGPDDLAQMRCLAADAELTAFETNPFRHGPAFGVWEQEQGRGKKQLVAMAATHLKIPGAAEIGNIATHPAHRRRGYAGQSVAALVQAHVAEGRRVFLMVFQDNPPAAQLYEGLGFVRLRPMFLLRCRLGVG